MYRSDDDVTHNAMSLLALTNDWILTRHQWLIDQVRCILTGEVNQAIAPLNRYDNLQLSDLALPESLASTFMETKHQLDALWVKTLKSNHPASGLDVYEQLNDFQLAAKEFMVVSKDAYQALWLSLAAHDPLTDAWSRLTLKHSLSDAIAQFQENGTVSTIALLDQNNFKDINDKWGHLVGDHVLSKTSQIIQASLRPQDKLFRYGGDEWLILMHDADKLAANNLVSRIQTQFDSHQFYGKTKEDIFYSTFSFGIAEVEQNTAVENWISSADYQLYAKKLKLKLSA